MAHHRLFLTAPLVPGEHVHLPLSEADLHHVTHVLRVIPGEVLEVIEPDTSGWTVEVTELGSSGVVARQLGSLKKIELPKVALYQGVPKGDKMDDIVRQCVEIGVDSITPVLTSRSVVRLDDKKRTAKGERWRRVAKAAAEQSHRSEVPQVLDPVDFSAAIVDSERHSQRIVLWEDAEKPGLVEAIAGNKPPAGDVALFVGPEGGFAAEEVARLQAVGAVPVTLGPTVLRTETAAVVAVALALHALGGLGPVNE